MPALLELHGRKVRIRVGLASQKRFAGGSVGPLAWWEPRLMRIGIRSAFMHDDVRSVQVGDASIRHPRSGARSIHGPGNCRGDERRANVGYGFD